MNWPPLGRGRSLTRSILLGTALVTLAGLACASAILYALYVGADSRVREATLQGEARRVAAFLREAPAATPVTLPAALVHTDVQEPVWCVVLDHAGRVVASLGGQAEWLWPPGAEPRSYFRRHDPATGVAQYGISERFDLPGGQVWVQIAASVGSDMIFDSLLEEFVVDFGWLLLPFGLLVLATNTLLIHRDLLPLREASAGAAAIGPGTPGLRLPEGAVPREILPLVHAVNGALDRLEAAADRQRQFVSDVAHELRTPVAVLRLQLDLLGDLPAAAALRRDLAAMERMVAQLLDLARLDGLEAMQEEAVELSGIGAEVVRHLGPLAIARGRSLALEHAAAPAWVRGCPDALFRAVRNLAENALHHAPAGTEVEIRVAPGPTILVEDRGPGIGPAERARIFERHWQGRRDREGGAGLGLAIVARTAAAHGAALVLETPPAGGTRIGLRFGPR
ncbi:MAG: sensor histidine kinase [Paracraurococcus sp.]